MHVGLQVSTLSPQYAHAYNICLIWHNPEWECMHVCVVCEWSSHHAHVRYSCLISHHEECVSIMHVTLTNTSYIWGGGTCSSLADIHGTSREKHLVIACNKESRDYSRWVETHKVLLLRPHRGCWPDQKHAGLGLLGDRSICVCVHNTCEADGQRMATILLIICGGACAYFRVSRWVGMKEKKSSTFCKGGYATRMHASRADFNNVQHNLRELGPRTKNRLCHLNPSLPSLNLFSHPSRVPSHSIFRDRSISQTFQQYIFS
jgi:hypothetical protein